MVNAILLLNVQREQINGVAERLADIDGVSEVYSVAGEFDIAVMVRARDNDELAELVTKRLLQENGITRSQTLIAFRAYSRHDLERIFSIGIDEGP
jgi:DNA-binding Lrp family transcriptional regulator